MQYPRWCTTLNKTMIWTTMCTTPGKTRMLNFLRFFFFFKFLCYTFDGVYNFCHQQRAESGWRPWSGTYWLPLHQNGWLQLWVYTAEDSSHKGKITLFGFQIQCASVRRKNKRGKEEEERTQKELICNLGNTWHVLLYFQRKKIN